MWPEVAKAMSQVCFSSMPGAGFGLTLPYVLEGLAWTLGFGVEGYLPLSKIHLGSYFGVNWDALQTPGGFLLRVTLRNSLNG